MNDHMKRFLRAIIVSGLPFGSIWAILRTIDSGWRYGIRSGATMGLLFGLISAVLNAREFSKPRHPLAIPHREIFDETVHSEFRLQRFLSIRNSILVALTVVLLFASMAIATNSNRVLQLIVAVIVVALGILWDVLRVALTRLTIYSNGVEFVSVFYRLTVAWENVVQIERRGQNWFIICSSSKLTTSPILDRWLRYIEADKIVSLRGFSSDFLKSELSDSILHYGKHVKFMSVQ